MHVCCAFEASDTGLLIPLLSEALVSWICHYICERKLIFKTWGALCDFLRWKVFGFWESKLYPWQPCSLLGRNVSPYKRGMLKCMNSPIWFQGWYFITHLRSLPFLLILVVVNVLYYNAGESLEFQVSKEAEGCLSCSRWRAPCSVLIKLSLGDMPKGRVTMGSTWEASCKIHTLLFPKVFMNRIKLLMSLYSLSYDTYHISLSLSYSTVNFIMNICFPFSVDSLKLVSNYGHPLSMSTYSWREIGIVKYIYMFYLLI